MANATEKYFYALGRRKTSSATVRIYEKSGDSQINEKDASEYYPSEQKRAEITEPFEVAGLKINDFMYTAKVQGGGKMSQIGAIRLAISRALVEMDSKNREPLKKAGFLTRDSRMVERKKTGLRKARKKEQFSKR